MTRYMLYIYHRGHILSSLGAKFVFETYRNHLKRVYLGTLSVYGLYDHGRVAIL